MGAATFPIAAFSGADASGRSSRASSSSRRRRGDGRLVVARRARRRRLALGPAGGDAERRGDRGRLPVPATCGGACVPDSGGAGRYRGGNSDGARRGPARRRPDPPPHRLGRPPRVPVPPLFGGYPSNVNTLHPAARHRRAGALRGGRVPGARPGHASARGGARPQGVRRAAEHGRHLRPAAGAARAATATRSSGRRTTSRATWPPSAVSAERGRAALRRRAFATEAVDAGATESSARGRCAPTARLERPGEASQRRTAARGCARSAPGWWRWRRDGRARLRQLPRRCWPPAGGNWKDGARVQRAPVQEGNLPAPVATFVDDDVVLRQFACPGCVRLLDTEVRRRSEPPLWDIRLGGAN